MPTAHKEQHPAYRDPEGIQNKVGDDIEVVYAEGCKITTGVQGWEAWYVDKVPLRDPEEDTPRIAEAVRVAQAADVAIVVVGGNESTCREAWHENHLGDRDSLDLLGRQDELVQAVVETGTPRSHRVNGATCSPTRTPCFPSATGSVTPPLPTITWRYHRPRSASAVRPWSALT